MLPAQWRRGAVRSRCHAGLLAVFVSMALHGALLWVQLPANPLVADKPAAQPSEPLRIRVVAGTGSTHSPPVALVSGASGGSATRLDQDMAPNTPTSAKVARSSTLETVPLVSDAPLDDAAPADAIAGYLPRHALTRVPRPLSDPVVSVAPGLGHSGDQRGTFSLFISASGTVDSVVRDGPTLSASIEEAAVEVLKATRFSPGEVDGIAVAALIRIEILFENQPPVSPSTPVIVSQQPL